MFAVVISRFDIEPFLANLDPDKGKLFFLQEDGMFKHSLEEARWLDTREEAKVVISKLSAGYRRERPRVMTVGNIIDAELKFQADRLKRAYNERAKAKKKLTKAQKKSLVSNAIKEGAKIFSKMSKDVPPMVINEMIR